MVNKRQHKRIPITGTATLKFEDEGNFLSIETMLGSISLGGIGIYCDDPLEIDTKVLITISFISEDGIRTDSIEGCVIYTKNLGGIYFMGIEFNKEINSEDQPSSYDYIQKVLDMR
jgi:c-di-GMP-binding flagellar brake protein YcgR